MGASQSRAIEPDGGLAGAIGWGITKWMKAGQARHQGNLTMSTGKHARDCRRDRIDDAVDICCKDVGVSNIGRSAFFACADRNTGIRDDQIQFAQRRDPVVHTRRIGHIDNPDLANRTGVPGLCRDMAQPVLISAAEMQPVSRHCIGQRQREANPTGCTGDQNLSGVGE